MFDGCTGLTSVVIGNSVTLVPGRMFRDCTSLANLTLGSAVSSIGDYALSGCSGLKTLYSLNTFPPGSGLGNFTNEQYMNLNVYVPQGALETYQNHYSWKNFWNLQETEVAGIAHTINNGQTAKEMKRYDATGRQINNLHKGLNIIKMSDGTTKKVVVK